MVPSLVYYCILCLSTSPDQAHLLDVRLNYRSSHFKIPNNTLDPRLWATLVQLYNGLPTSLSIYNIPFDNPHLPLLQHISNTSLFSLITILELPACPQVTDATIMRFGALHTLVAFDASNTSLTPYAIRTLAAALQTDESSYRGPWPLRILRLRNCKSITNDVFPHLAKFVLLAVIDLRGTQCIPDSSIPPEFQPGNDQLLYHPTSLFTALSALHQLSPTLHSSRNPFTLQITTLTDPLAKPKTRLSTVAPQNSFVVVPRKTVGSQSRKIIIGNTETLVREQEQRDRPGSNQISLSSFRHELNQMPFYNDAEEDESSDDNLDVDDELPETDLSPAVDPSGTRDRDREERGIRQINKARELAAATFYAHPRLRRSIDQLSTKPSLDPREAMLMLYREPPAWSSLADVVSGIQKKEMIRTKKKKEESRRPPDVAVVDRSGGKAAAAKQHLEDLLMRRRHGTVGDVSQQPQARSSKPSRNPFKRNI